MPQGDGLRAVERASGRDIPCHHVLGQLRLGDLNVRPETSRLAMCVSCN